MLKRLAMGLGFVLGLGAMGLAAAQERPGEEEKERGLLGAGGTRAEELEVGVLKLSKEDARQVKDMLAQRGYSFKSMEGIWDDELESAVEKFQKDVGIEETGEMDMATLDALGFGAIVAIHPDVRGSDLVRQQFPQVTELPAGLPKGLKDLPVVGRAITGRHVIGYLVLGKDHIENIQDALKDQGYYTGNADGAFSAEFMDGIRRFQQAKGIKAAQPGQLDLATLAWFPDSVEVAATEESEISAPRTGGEREPGLHEEEEESLPERR